VSRTTEKTVDCDRAALVARRAKAEEFFASAEELGDERADTFVSLCVLAGIAASDVICCARLGVHASGDDHSNAVGLLASVDRPSAKALQQLLSMKTKTAYSPSSPSSAEVKRARRAAAALVEAANRVGQPFRAT
jgi:hypothetical protein